MNKKINVCRGTWVAQSVKHPTLDFSSGHDLRVMRSSPAGACLRFSLSLCCPPPTGLLKLSKKKNHTHFDLSAFPEFIASWS